MDFSASPPLAPHHREHALECRHCAEWDLINLRGERIGTQSQAHRVSRTHKPCPMPPGLPHAQHTQVWEQTDMEPPEPHGLREVGVLGGSREMEGHGMDGLFWAWPG